MQVGSPQDGLLQIDVDKLEAINRLDEVMIASRHRWFPVRKGDKIAATRVIPLIVEESKVRQAEQIAGNRPLMDVVPYIPYRIGIVTTGSEVYHERIQDAFGPVLRKKAKEYDMEVNNQIIVDDNRSEIGLGKNQGRKEAQDNDMR